MIYCIQESLNHGFKLEKLNDTYRIKNSDGKIVSSLKYYDYNIKNFDWVLIADVDTDENYRRQGLAKRLINELYKDIQKKFKGSKGLYLFVKPNNDPAIALYKNLKFQEIKHYKLKDGDYIIMAKGNTSKFNQFDNMNFS